MAALSVIPSPSVMDRPLRRREASDYLLVRHGIERKPGTLAKLAVQGHGPLFRKAGRVPLYDVTDLDAWAQAITTPKVRSTSELPRNIEKAAPSES